MIGFAVGDRSTGAMEPFTVQYAGSPLAASTHRGASSVTADTGSPIAVTGISLPSLVAVQSASLIVLEGDCARVAAPVEHKQPASAAVNSRPIRVVVMRVSAFS